MDPQPLSRAFYARDPASVARDLVGKQLIRQSPAGLAAGRIVEVEAYLSGRDPACHANRGMTRRNATMFGPPGHAYVYMIHSRWCLNAVTEDVGLGSAVLIRAIEPLVGLDLMRERRGREQLLDLARGPARLCQSLDVTKQFDGWDLTVGRELWIADDPSANSTALRIIRSPRIGISSARHRLLRFYLAGSKFVSGRRMAVAKRTLSRRLT
jgi:DNA-3-methyladenine glycosylase